MRCRQCGLELDERDRLRNGAYQCPECGAIHHTASSSRKSPSPWRKRKNSNPFASPASALTQRFFGLPLWAWGAIAVAVIVAIVLLVCLGGRADKPAADMPAAQDAPILEVTANPGGPSDATASTDTSEAAEPTAEPTASRNTGVQLNDFLVSFDWAMNYLNYNATLTLSSTETADDGSTVQNYTFDSWLELVLTLDPTTNVVRSARVDAHIEEGATDNTPVLAAFVSAMYGLDNTVNATEARTEVEAMIADPTRAYDRQGYSATLSVGAFSGYTLEIVGKLS